MGQGSGIRIRSDLIDAGDSQAKENWQEEECRQQGVDALPEAHVDELEAVVIDLRGNTQDLDGRHKTGAERQPDGHGRHGPAASEKVVGVHLRGALPQGVEEPDGHRDGQHGGKDAVVGQQEARPAALAGGLVHDLC